MIRILLIYMTGLSGTKQKIFVSENNVQYYEGDILQSNVYSTIWCMHCKLLSFISVLGNRLTVILKNNSVIINQDIV